MKEYEVIIVGGGPAGIFAALTLAEGGARDVLLLEQGKGIGERSRSCAGDMLCGWGGAGAYSDGKLTLSTEVGGNLGDFLDVKSLYDLLQEADRLYVEHGAPDRLFGDLSPEGEELGEKARLAGLEFIPSRIRHIGTENCIDVLGRMYESLAGKIEICTDCRVESLLAQEGRIIGVKLADGETRYGRHVIAAPGRSGASWMKREARALGIRTRASAVDIGVRVELPATVLKPLTDVSYESKLVYYSKSFDDRVRTFCMNPYGEVVVESNEGLVTVNGHSYASKKSDNTNFAILVSSSFTEPFDDPIAYGRYIAQLANLLGQGVIVQRLGDLLQGRRSTRERIAKCLTRPTLAAATPGDLSFVFPYRHLKNIIEMLQAMDSLAPGVSSRHTLLYGVEVKFYSSKVPVQNNFETEISGLYAIGDGAGITRGLMQASCTGIAVARDIDGRM